MDIQGMENVLSMCDEEFKAKEKTIQTLQGFLAGLGFAKEKLITEIRAAKTTNKTKRSVRKKTKKVDADKE